MFSSFLLPIEHVEIESARDDTICGILVVAQIFRPFVVESW